jgi:hypothetical protein
MPKKILSKFPVNIELVIPSITLYNRKIKFVSAAKQLAKALNIPHEIVKAQRPHAPEPYFYKFQEELAERWAAYYQFILKTIYQGVINALGLPQVEAETIRKAIGDDLLRYRKWGWFGRILSLFGYKGKVVFNPETGEPVNQKEFDELVDAITKFLNRKTAAAGGKMILDSTVAGKLLRRMARYNTTADMEKITLDNLRYRGKTFDWITDSVKNVRNVMGEELTRWEQARYQATQDWAAQKVTQINDMVRNEIKDTLLGGILEHRTKGQVSQDLFNRLGRLNRDWKRIADTEIVNSSNLAGIMEEVHKRPEGEKIYFKRFELPRCCEKCAKVNGVIALWSDTPLADDKIKDPYAAVAIWEGKPQEKGKTVLVTGTLHPNCYTSDTEVMTKNGWKLFKNLLDDDKIMSINPKNQEIDFVPFVNRTTYEYHGKMVRFFGRNYDLCVTPDHNMLFVSKKGFYQETSAGKLLHKRNYYLPRAIGNWRKTDAQNTVVFGDLEISKKQYFRLWAWYLAEGNGRKREKNSHEVKLAQKIPGNIIKDLPELRDVLHELADSVCLYGQYAESFKEMFGIRAEDKYIPRFVKESSVENIRAFLEAFSLADGTNRIREGHKTSYSDKHKEMYVRTSSRRMADDLCELVIKSGWMPSVDIIEEKGKTVHFQNGDYVINTNCYNINICKSKFRGFGIDNQPGHKERHEPYEEDYHGMVYDVELEKWHFLLVKRNGKCAWSGNCRGGWVPWGGNEADAMTEKLENKSKQWDEAVTRAREEYRQKGIENPNDQTKGYTDRINEIYQSLTGQRGK